MKKILFLLLPLISFNFCHALSLTDIRTEIRRSVRDNPSDTDRRRYSDSVLLDYINEAQREVVNATWLSEKTTSYSLRGGVTYYALPNDFLVAMQVYFDDYAGQRIELQETSQRKLYDEDPNWERTGGDPYKYWISNSTKPQSQETAPLRISYIPILTHISTGNVTVWYAATVADLASDNDVPFDNRRHLYPYHMALAYHSATRILLQEGKTEEASAYQQLYNNSLEIMKGRLGEMPNYRSGIVTPR